MSDELRNKIIINAEKVDANRTEMEKLHLVMEGNFRLVFDLCIRLTFSTSRNHWSFLNGLFNSI